MAPKFHTAMGMPACRSEAYRCVCVCTRARAVDREDFCPSVVIATDSELK